jgi:hypothetical protein
MENLLRVHKKHDGEFYSHQYNKYDHNLAKIPSGVEIISGKYVMVDVVACDQIYQEEATIVVVFSALPFIYMRPALFSELMFKNALRTEKLPKGVLL